MFVQAVSSLIGGVIVLIYTIGSSSIAGLVTMLVVLFINGYVGYQAKLAERGNKKAADERVSIVKKVIDSITAIKLSSWEMQFLAKIDQARARESKFIEVNGE